MAKQRPSTKEFFEDMRCALHHGTARRDAMSQVQPNDPKSGHPLNVEHAEFAFRQTAAACLGPDHAFCLHSFHDGKRVGAQLRTIAEQCAAELQGATEDMDKIREEIGDLFTTAFIFADDPRSLARHLERHPSLVLSQNRTLAA